MGMDIKQTMQQLGKNARAASRLMAKADTAAKNRALLAIATAIRRDAGQACIKRKIHRLDGGRITTNRRLA